MKPFSEGVRYEYPLNRESLVLDIGCHRGEFSRILHEKYGCFIEAFEPVPEFYEHAVIALNKHPKITVHKLAVGDSDKFISIRIKGDMTGIYCNDGEELSVEQISLAHVLESKYPHLKPDLVKVNIEGGEYALLRHAISCGLTTEVKNWQVQFHNLFPGAAEEREAIRESLSKTHRLTYDEPWIWESWERK